MGAPAEVIPIHAQPAEPVSDPAAAASRTRDRGAERAERLARLRAGLPAPAPTSVGAAAAPLPETPRAAPEAARSIAPGAVPARPESAAPETTPETTLGAAGTPGAGWRAEDLAPETATQTAPAAGFAEIGFGFRLAPIPAPAFLAGLGHAGESAPDHVRDLAPDLAPEAAPEATREATLAETRARAVIAGLDRLPGAGPGLVWALRAAGIPDLASVAALDPATLAARLGPIGRLVPAAAWIAAARAACEDPARGSA